MPSQDQGIAHSQDRYHLIPRVLCFVTLGNEVLLIRGAPHKKLWANRYNGLGGHVERGESPHAAAAREIQEEAGLNVTDLQLRGVVTVDTGDPVGVGLYVFTARAAERTVRASAEGALVWTRPEDWATLDLVEDLPALLPRALTAPTPFSAQYRYDGAGRLQIQFFPA